MNRKSFGNIIVLSISTIWPKSFGFMLYLLIEFPNAYKVLMNFQFPSTFGFDPGHMSGYGRNRTPDIMVKEPSYLPTMLDLVVG
ncbi:hypothetical protein RIF29_38975 [Crotalaria pallida]|uniref:Uncharacterized protein n=1 Tax=Crotalaria pallida TaxID=3830 RepID=A0AAN9HQ89_CROPI